MRKYVYEMPPVDFWAGWSNIDALKLKSQYIDPYPQNLYFDKYKIEGYEDYKEVFKREDYEEADQIVLALDLIRDKTTWEGDGRLYVTAQPNDEYRVQLCFAVKQGNNGTTFLCSDYELPNLREYLVS